VNKRSAQDRYVTAITVVSCSSSHTPLGNWSTGERQTHDLYGRKQEQDHYATDISVVNCSNRHAALGKWWL